MSWSLLGPRMHLWWLLPEPVVCLPLKTQFTHQVPPPPQDSLNSFLRVVSAPYFMHSFRAYEYHLLWIGLALRTRLMYGTPCGRRALGGGACLAREAAYLWLTASAPESDAWCQTRAPPLTWVITCRSELTSVCFRIFAFEDREHQSHETKDNNSIDFIEWLWTSVIQQILSMEYVRHCTRAWRCSKEQTPPCLCETYIRVGVGEVSK